MSLGLGELGWKVSLGSAYEEGKRISTSIILFENRIGLLFVA